jgi:hypothetical protein
MKEVIRYLMGWPGPSGHGSASTAEEVTQNLSLPPNLTALITGLLSLSLSLSLSLHIYTYIAIVRLPLYICSSIIYFKLWKCV